MNLAQMQRHRSAAVVLALVVAMAGACGPDIPPATPTSLPTGTASPSPTATTAATAATTSAGPTATPLASPSATAATACVVTPQTGILPSDRFTDLQVSTGAIADRLTFVFGDPSLPGPTVPPKGSLAVAKRPYTQAASGAAIVMVGAHVVQIRFTGMAVQNDAGEETYAGPAELKPGLPALRHAVLYDASEGVIGWYVGYDGPGCVVLARVGTTVTVTIAHP